jgi:cytochrome c-type biogenesis protein CcmE
MKRFAHAIILSGALAASAAFGAESVMVGGQSMYAAKDIVDNAVNSENKAALTNRTA